MWIFVLLAAFAVLGLIERPATVRMHLWALVIVAAVIALQATALRSS